MINLIRRDVPTKIILKLSDYSEYSGCDSKLDSSISRNEVFPQDYKINRTSNNPGGEVFIIVHNSILATHQPNLDN